MTNVRVYLIISLIINLLMLSIYVVNSHKKPKAIKRLPEEQTYFTRRISLYETLSIDQNSIVFIGDSLTEGCEWTEIFSNTNVKNRGISGDTSDRVLQRLDSIVSVKPDKIFIMVGTNDLLFGREVSNIIDNYRQIIYNIKAASPDTKIFIQSVLPIDTQRILNNNNDDRRLLNDKLKRLSKRYDCYYIDLYSPFDKNGELNQEYTYDGIHLNGKGYILWKGIIEKYVQ